MIFDSNAWKSAIGEVNRSHLYGFGTLEDRATILGGSSTQTATSGGSSSQSTTNQPDPNDPALQDLFKKWLSEQLPGMLSELGYLPMNPASRNNMVPLSSDVQGLRTNDSEESETEIDDDDNMDS